MTKRKHDETQKVDFYMKMRRKGIKAELEKLAKKHDWLIDFDDWCDASRHFAVEIEDVETCRSVVLWKGESSQYGINFYEDRLVAETKIDVDSVDRISSIVENWMLRNDRLSSVVKNRCGR